MAKVFIIPNRANPENSKDWYVVEWAADMTAGEAATRIAASLGAEVDIIKDVGDFRPRVMQPEEPLTHAVSRCYRRYRLRTHSIQYKIRA